MITKDNFTEIRFIRRGGKIIPMRRKKKPEPEKGMEDQAKSQGLKKLTSLMFGIG